MEQIDEFEVETESTLFQQYKSLILHKERVKAAAAQYYDAYLRVFGMLKKESFELRIDCIRLKKSIAYCLSKVNKGETIDGDVFDSYIHDVMSSYNDDLTDLIDEIDSARNGRKIDVYRLSQIKKIYHKIVKQIHPDIHPTLFENLTVKEYWYQVQDAYQRNDFDTLEQYSALVDALLNEIGEASEPEIEDLEDKIENLKEEIEAITSKEPYLYKYLLDNEEEISKRKESLQKDIEGFKEYKIELEEKLAEFEIKRMVN